MAPAAAFAEVLDRYVGLYESGEPAAARRWQPGVATPALFWFARSSSLPRALDADVPEGARPCANRPGVAAEVRRAPTRVLSDRQREALRELTAAGACLDPQFTREELRTAFRMLARRYHPDRHPASGHQEKSRLAARFATIKSAYDALKTAA